MTDQRIEDARSLTHEDSAILIAFYKRQGHKLGVVNFTKLRAFDDQTPLHARKSTGIESVVSDSKLGLEGLSFFSWLDYSRRSKPF